MEMMRAVLDSNFWLATHVVTITIGYSGTFLAGAIAIGWAVREHLAPRLDPATSKALSSMVYGVVCFALFFSFLGTVLGGIWADQSWGRFWGWDPKENGALLIVLWNAIILHARWGGFVARARDHGDGDLRQRHHRALLVRREHARRRAPLLRLHGQGVLGALRLLRLAARAHGARAPAAPLLEARDRAQPRPT